MCVCKGCGRTISSDFLFCPWCGFSRIRQNDVDSDGLLYEKYKALKAEHEMSRIRELEQELDSLEQELSVLVLSTEMHK